MKKVGLTFKKGFRVKCSNSRSQIAEMVLGQGEVEGGHQNKHRGSDQWLLVVEGTGVAIINRKRYALKPHVVILIEKGDLHEIRNTGSMPLKTLNLYLPPAYSDSGRVLPTGRT